MHDASWSRCIKSRKLREAEVKVLTRSDRKDKQFFIFTSIIKFNSFIPLKVTMTSTAALTAATAIVATTTTTRIML